jgi:ribosomal protein S18 acetylase RimI-like enzyme
MIRRATVADAAAIAAIHVTTWQVAYKGLIPSEYLATLTIEKKTEFWRQKLADGRTFVLVGLRKEEIVGWISAGPSRDSDANGVFEIYALYVSPLCWRQGVGSQLVRRVEDAFSSEKQLTLWVLRGNQRAIGFYQTMGYALDGCEREEQIGTRQVEIRFRKKLPSHAPEPTALAATPPGTEKRIREK